MVDSMVGNMVDFRIPVIDSLLWRSCSQLLYCIYRSSRRELFSFFSTALHEETDTCVSDSRKKKFTTSVLNAINLPHRIIAECL